MLSAVVGTLAVQWTSTYVSHNNQLFNQERGTYIMITYKASNWQSMGASSIAAYKAQHYNSMMLMEVILNGYTSKALTSTVMNNINNELQLYRSCGIKAIMRFTYTETQGGSAPWGDATSPSVVFNHISQLTPTLKANEDVIAYVQTGFVGIWGEWFYTDSFGDQGRISAQNMADRKNVHELLLKAVPNRTVQLRTPGFIQNFYGTAAITQPGSSSLARTGTHNDCFLASSTDQGTYANYGKEYPYLSAQTKYTSAIFETCAVSSRSTCPTALTEIAGLHMVSGHRDYNTDVWNQWISGGCYNQILMTLGHRFNFVSGAYDLQTAVGSSFSSTVTIKNSGVAAPSNARLTQIIMRKVDDGQICVATMPVDARTMLGGTTFSIKSTVRLPSSIPAGRWELLMHFADPYSTLYGVPWYKIQAANNGIYESGTGLHKLNAILDVLPGTANAVVAGEVVAKCGLSLRDIVNATVTSGDSSCLGGYYKVGGVCTMCPAGSACSSATSSPVKCASNTWSAGGQRTCTACTSCSSKGTCQANTGACLCQSGWSGFDCSLASSSTPVTANPTSGQITNPPVTVPPVTVAPATKKPTAAPGSTSAPETEAPEPNAPVVPVVTTSCTGAKNLLYNPSLTATGNTITGWTGDFVPATGLQKQPSAQLYIPVGTTGLVKTLSQTVTFTTPTSNTISFGAYVQSWLISGVLDWDYMLYISINHVDGKVVDYGLRAPVPSSDWVWLGSSYNPTKPVASVTLTMLLKTHTGSAWVTQPVIALAPVCSVTGGPGGVSGGIVLAAGESSTGLSDSVLLGIYIAAGCVALLIAAGVGTYCYRKRTQERAVENAVAAQVASV